MTPSERGLAAVWPFVRDQLPAPPVSVLEIRCGPHGGLVPQLLRGGYDAVGVDPEAPEAAEYRRLKFEQYVAPDPVAAVVACTSLHHVEHLDDVLDRVAAVLKPGGVLVVVEWAWERFDESSARWCFARLAPSSSARELGWLHRHRDQWAASGQPWDDYLQLWAKDERLHLGEQIIRGLDECFDRELCTFGPYFFPDLSEPTDGAERAAIDASEIQATGIRYVGRLR